MPTHTAQYHYISCSAKTGNLLVPVCQAQSDADFGELDPVIETALQNGWARTANGRDFLCPAHSKLAVQDVDKPAPKPRVRKDPFLPHEGS
jgi:hypothetical protein